MHVTDKNLILPNKVRVDEFKKVLIYSVIPMMYFIRHYT